MVDGSVLFVGPFPPPSYGQAIATQELALRLESAGVPLVRHDLAAASWLGKIWRHVLAGASIFLDRGPCYISLNSNAGMWLSAFLAGVARVRGRPLILHHHAYAHVRRRKRAMLVTGWLAGESALHVVLGQRMAADLRRSTPSVRRTLVLNNAGLVERPPSLARRSTDGPFILGHLSNLTRPKGVELVIDAAAGAHRAGHAIELWVAGPCHDRHAREAIDRGRKELGEKFRYLGPLNGDAKYTFYSQLDLFLFPTFYRNEAAPLVLLEALACGTPCVATDVGCISEQLGRDGGTVSTIETFAADVLMWVAQTARERQIGSERATQQFTHLAQEHTSQMSALIELLTSGREPPTGGVRYLSNPSSGPGLLR